MRAIIILLSVAVLGCGAVRGAPATHLGSQPTPDRPRCISGGADTTGGGYFEFQVERAAESEAMPAALARLGAEGALIQFVVDTAGVPELATLRVIEPAMPPSEKLKTAVGTWRFIPAELAGCRVRQVVQQSVSRAIR